VATQRVAAKLAAGAAALSKSRRDIRQASIRHPQIASKRRGGVRAQSP
jgi:hypothetical protein